MKSTERKHSVWSYLLLYPVALILVFEEWGWTPLAAQFDKLTKLTLWRHLEEKVIHLPPLDSLVVLAIPFFALIPMKLFGLFLFDKGHILSGFVVIATSKLFGTAIFARLFQLTLPSLMKINWFARWYPRWKAWKDDLLGSVRQSRLWKLGLLFKEKIKLFLSTKNRHS